MSARTIGGIAAALVAISAPPALGAQAGPTCPDTVTVGQCLRLSMGEGEVGEKTTRATTGADLVSGSVSSAIRDFLPRVAGAVLAPGLEADRGALALRINQRLGFATGQLGVELNEPVLYTPLVDAIPQSLRTASTERLEKELDDQDDVSATFALNLENRRLGRAFAPHRAWAGALVSQIAGDAGVTNVFDLGAVNNLDFAGKKRPERRSDEECRNANAAQVHLGCFLPAFADSVRQAVRSEAQALLARRELRRAAVAEAGLDAIAMLLNNQPQLNATASYRYRDDLVGPDELKASFRYEHGLVNLNWLRGRLRNRQACQGSETQCFTRLVNDPRTRDAIARAARLWGEVDLSFRSEYDFISPVDSVALTEERATELRLAAGYGQYFGRLEDGTRRPRIDVDASFHRQLEGSSRTDRAVGKIAYTQPISDALAGVFGVTWANKPEYLGDVQRKLTGTLGLTYKLVQPDDKE